MPIEIVRKGAWNKPLHVLSNVPLQPPISAALNNLTGIVAMPHTSDFRISKVLFC